MKDKKPESLSIDGEVFKIDDISFAKDDPRMIFIEGARMCLSPYEAQELADWLIEAVKWIKKRDKE